MKKRLLFIAYLLVFLIYSMVVYSDGTSHFTGEDLHNSSAKNGKQLFREFNCISCHQLYGLGGYMGPDLTNFMSGGKPSEILARAYLQNGTERMPNFKLSEVQIDELVSFLKYVNAAAKYPPVDIEINSWGAFTEITTLKNDQ